MAAHRNNHNFDFCTSSMCEIAIFICSSFNWPYKCYTHLKTNRSCLIFSNIFNSFLLITIIEPECSLELLCGKQVVLKSGTTVPFDWLKDKSTNIQQHQQGSIQAFNVLVMYCRYRSKQTYYCPTYYSVLRLKKVTLMTRKQPMAQSTLVLETWLSRFYSDDLRGNSNAWTWNCKKLCPRSVSISLSIKVNTESRMSYMRQQYRTSRNRTHSQL